MTKQEEIREVIAKRFFLQERTNREYVYRYPSWGELGESAKQPYLNKADEWLEYLHSQGVVIKVDEELELDDEALMARVLPDIFDGSLSWSQYSEEQDKYLAIAKPIEEELKGAGYVATEPLIKDGI